MPETTDAALRLNGVSKRYRGKKDADVCAVNGLSLEMAPGTCLGLLGPNGAGKSTTMRLLTGQTVADSGTIEVLGFLYPHQSKSARARMGVVPQLDNLDAELTVGENLEVFACFYRVPRTLRRRSVEIALDRAALWDRRHTRVADLSGGMRRRLLIARALVHDPQLVLLDEPTVGLDPQMRAGLWELLASLRERGVATLLSTHHIEEAERLADVCAFVLGGRVVARGEPHRLVLTHAGKAVEEHEGSTEWLAELERRAAEAGLPTRRIGRSVALLRAEEAPPSLRDLLDTATRPGDHGRVVRREANLEDAFFVLTGEEVM